MAERETTQTLGLPVKIGEIGAELKKLWAEGDGSKTRASLINLVVYAEEKDSLARNTELVSAITEEHACRAIVVESDPAAEGSATATWINAHCHARAGTKQVCSEQISFRLGGEACRRLPNIVFAELDSDLPLYLWWQAELSDELDVQLWHWIDRLIFDTRNWTDFRAPWQIMKDGAQAAKRRIALCDLNWTRLFHVRVAFAQFFDHPASHHRLEKMEKISIRHGRGFRSTAMLLVGWLAAQLKWERDGKEFRNASGGKVEMTIVEEGEAPISELSAVAGEVEFSVRRAACGDLLEVGRGARGKKFARQMMPGGSNAPAELLKDELNRGGPHRVYCAAVEKVLDLL